MLGYSHGAKSVKRIHASFLAMAVLVFLGGFYLWFRAAMRVADLPAPAIRMKAGVQTQAQGGPRNSGAACFDPNRNIEVPCPVLDPLVEAARQNDVQGVERLLARRHDINTLNKALFAVAESAGLFMEAETRKEVKQDEAHGFHYARVAKLLLENGASVETREQDGRTPLIAAAGYGEDDVVKLLLGRGADIEAVDDGGQTALIAASCNCPIVDMADTSDSVRALLEKGANIEARDKRGRTALMTAAAWGREGQVRLLLDWGASIDATDSHGNTALLIAASGSAYPTADAAEALLRRGADIEARNDSGDTALILAASGGGSEDVRVVRLLLDRGADLHARNRQGYTALELARKNGRRETAALAGAAMAKSR
jgi:ankyrin repeat protein